MEDIRKVDIFEEKMRLDYIDFDPIKFKYAKLFKSAPSDDSYSEEHIKFYEYEDSQQFAELTKKDFHDLQKNLDIVYANEKVTDFSIEIYDLVCDRIVRRYINIDGVERLFSEKYADFEWEMHLGIDYKKHSMKYSRDHFIHQIKDAYTMVKLLEEGGFYEKVKRILLDKGNSKISRFVCKMLHQQMYLPKRTIFSDYNEDRLEEHYIYNIIYMSSYMAGLFHDIGYPASTNRQKYRQMMDYMAESVHFENGNYDFNRIMLLLQNSLLFRVVSPTEIRQRIESDKVDHGAMSALIFLLHFYENGAIHRLEPYKLCAVELAGLAIYNHTNHYSYIGQEKANYERCVFVLNPISYLLRICDDLQEWDRVYFEVSNHSNLILCKKCHMPILRSKSENCFGEVSYRCNCQSDKEDGLFSPMFHYEQFSYRRIYNVRVCSKLQIKFEETENPQKYEFILKYDLDKLLHIAYLNPKYARERIKELNYVKKLFPRQYDLGVVYVGYFVSANIILIKAAIIEEYVKEKEIGEEFCKELRKKMMYINTMEHINTSQRKMVLEEVKALAKELREVLYMSLCKEDMERDMEEYWDKAFLTYIFIYMMMVVGKKSNTEKNNLRKKYSAEIIELVKQLCEEDELKGFYSSDTKNLVIDCGWQAGRLYDNLQEYDYYPDNYFETFKPVGIEEDAYYGIIERFVDMGSYKPLRERDSKSLKLDAYTDLYYFKKMLWEIEEIKKEKEKSKV